MIGVIALMVWPVVSLILFVTMSTQRAVIWSLIGGYLALPVAVGFDFPGVPTLDKSSIPSVAAFLLALGLARPGQFRWPKSPIINLLMAAFVFGSFMTGLFNLDPISIGPILLPGMTLYAAMSMAVGKIISLMPFILGAALLRTEQAHRDVLLAFVIAALAYCAPVMLEIVKGPFLQARLYGVDAGFYDQQMRGGGFRAMVFLGHGLLVSSFLGMAIVAAIGLWREKVSVLGLSALLCAIVLAVMLVLNKSLGALIFTALFAPMIAFLKPRRFLTIGVILATILMSYPILRANNLIPINTISSIATSFSSERGGSFDFRLRNEDMLLNRAQQRSLFGWGDFGRNRIFVLDESGGARDISITDGLWVITLGATGWVGYLSLFGLLCYPFGHLFKMRRTGVSVASAALAAMLLFNLLDLIPNSSLRPLTWMLAGALAGLSYVRKPARFAEPAAARGHPETPRSLTPA